MSTEGLTIDIGAAPDGAAKLFSLAGNFDIATSPSVRAALVAAAERDEHDIIVDLSQVEFLDSTGLGALIGAHKRAAEHHGSVRLVVREGQIVRLLRITGLLDVFDVYPSVAAALCGEGKLAGL
ncbi:MAG: STAS domain-containing protein [Vulcanimicrobiaceae bacterium]